MRPTQLDRPYRNIDCHPSPDMRTKWTVVGLAGVPKASNEEALVLCFQPIPSEGENRWMQEPSSFCPAELHRVEAGVSAWRDNWTDHSLESQFRDADHQLNLER